MAEWETFVACFTELPNIAQNDEQLGASWLGPWEKRSGARFRSAVVREADRAYALLKELRLTSREGPDGYKNALRKLGGFDQATRGSGTNTAIAAALLASYGATMPIEDVICLGANELGSDTDTIASMAGAVLGAAHGGEPEWTIQDRDYIVQEAVRLAEIAAGIEMPSFPYPDLPGWSPPATEEDGIGMTDEGLWLAGLGKAEPMTPAGAGSETNWQWFELEFGQTVLAERRINPRKLSKADLPAAKMAPR